MFDRDWLCNSFYIWCWLLIDWIIKYTLKDGQSIIQPYNTLKPYLCMWAPQTLNKFQDIHGKIQPPSRRGVWSERGERVDLGGGKRGEWVRRGPKRGKGRKHWGREEKEGRGKGRRGWGVRVRWRGEWKTRVAGRGEKGRKGMGSWSDRKRWEMRVGKGKGCKRRMG